MVRVAIQNVKPALILRGTPVRPAFHHSFTGELRTILAATNHVSAARAHLRLSVNHAMQQGGSRTTVAAIWNVKLVMEL